MMAWGKEVVTKPMVRSEDKFRKLVLSFHLYMGSRYQTWVVRFLQPTPSLAQVSDLN